MSNTEYTDPVIAAAIEANPWADPEDVARLIWEARARKSARLRAEYAQREREANPGLLDPFELVLSQENGASA